MILRLENERIKLKVTSLQLLCQLRLMRDRGDLILTKPIKKRKINKKEPKREQGDPLFADSGHASSEIPEWLQGFREKWWMTKFPEHGDSHASSSHEASLEPISSHFGSRIQRSRSNGCVSSCSEWCRACLEPVLMVSS